ncbi:MAG TPA: phosphoglycerate dehydrogenase [Clostridiaceae bacterium]|nr:phosphoglycerate dehydrogenase [Clostridiaceae bacterium]
MMKKVLITPRSFPEAGKEAYKLLRENGFEIIDNKTGKTLTEEQMIEMCAEVDGIIVGVDPVTERVMKNAKKLKAVSKYGAGLDNIDLKAAETLGIKVDRAAGTNATSVAELTIGLFFTLARNIYYSAKSVKSGGWDRLRGIELYGKTVGILGFGNIGKEVARIAHGIGMNVIAYDPYVSDDDESVKKYSVKMMDKSDVIKNADFLTLHIPLTDGTKHIINKETIDTMKTGAYLVNTARGELVDEDALYDALVAGKLAGAAADVFSKEPPEGHKLLKLDNFILVAHMGAYTKEANEKMALKSAENLIKMLE